MFKTRTSISTQPPVAKDKLGPVPVYDNCCTTLAIFNMRD